MVTTQTVLRVVTKPIWYYGNNTDSIVSRNQYFMVLWYRQTV